MEYPYAKFQMARQKRVPLTVKYIRATIFSMLTLLGMGIVSILFNVQGVQRTPTSITFELRSIRNSRWAEWKGNGNVAPYESELLSLGESVSVDVSRSEPLETWPPTMSSPILQEKEEVEIEWPTITWSPTKSPNEFDMMDGEEVYYDAMSDLDSIINSQTSDITLDNSLELAHLHRQNNENGTTENFFRQDFTSLERTAGVRGDIEASLNVGEVERKNLAVSDGRRKQNATHETEFEEPNEGKVLYVRESFAETVENNYHMSNFKALQRNEFDLQSNRLEDESLISIPIIREDTLVVGTAEANDKYEESHTDIESTGAFGKGNLTNEQTMKKSEGEARSLEEEDLATKSAINIDVGVTNDADDILRTDPEENGMVKQIKATTDESIEEDIRINQLFRSELSAEPEYFTPQSDIDVWKTKEQTYETEDAPSMKSGGIGIDNETTKSNNDRLLEDVRVNELFSVELTAEPEYLTSPVRPMPAKLPEGKYLLYTPSGGFNNQLVCLLNALFLAHKSNRTLVVPPVAVHRNHFQNYLRQNRDSIVPMKALVDVNYMAKSSGVRLWFLSDSLGKFMRSQLDFPWGKNNPGLKSRNDTEIINLTRHGLTTGKNETHEMVINRTMSSEKNFLILFGRFYSRQWTEEHKVFRERVKYSARILKLAQSAISLIGPEYNALHVRVGDKFDILPRLPKYSNGEAYIAKMNQLEFQYDVPLFMATDAPSSHGYLSRIHERFGEKIFTMAKLERMKQLRPEVKALKRLLRSEELFSNVVGLVEQIICARSNKFIGFLESTFSKTISFARLHLRHFHQKFHHHLEKKREQLCPRTSSLITYNGVSGWYQSDECVYMFGNSTEISRIRESDIHHRYNRHIFKSER